MTKWARSVVATVCGGCRSVIPVGAPMFLFVLERVKAGRRTKVRCETCAGPAPPDLPLLVETYDLETRRQRSFPLTRFTPDMLPLDFKARQVEREPGEEG